MMMVAKTACDSAHEADDILEMLVQHGANVNARNKEGCTAIFLAAERVKLFDIV